MHGMLEVRRGEAVLSQIAHLGAPMQDSLHAAIQWRILFPAVGKLMTAVGLPASSVFVWSYLGAFAVIAYLVHVLRRLQVPWLPAAAGILALSATTWWFASACWLGYFDSWLILGALLVTFSPIEWPVYAACLLCPWIDERFVITATVALTCRYLLTTTASSAIDAGNRSYVTPPLHVGNRPLVSSPSSVRNRSDVSTATNVGNRPNVSSAPDVGNRSDVSSPTPVGSRSAVEAASPPLISPPDAATRRPHPRRLYAISGALLLTYACVRLCVLPTPPSATPTGYLHAQHLATTPGTVLLALWESLRGAWLFIILAVLLLRRFRLPLLLVILALTLLALTTAQDFARSLELLFPIAATGAVLSLIRPFRSPRPFHPALLYTAAALGLLLPAHQVMSDRTTPIFYLYHELNTLSNPPASASPTFYELRGILAMEHGELAQANADLSLAIDLSPQDPASPAQQRGVLYASNGRWADAQKDFTTVLTAEPQNPDGWFLRAQSDLALQQPVEARSDFNRALAVGGSTFFSRPDVQRFAQRLGP